MQRDRVVFSLCLLCLYIWQKGLFRVLDRWRASVSDSESYCSGDLGRLLKELQNNNNNNNRRAWERQRDAGWGNRN